MSDNVPITPGTGAVIATDDVAGVHYQVVKFNVGQDGESKPLSPTNRLPVELPTGVTLTVALDAPALAALIAAATPTTQAVSLNAAAMTALANAATPAGLATTAGQSAIITALGSLLQAGGTVSLDAASLAALESITVQQSALPTGASTEATLAALNAKFASLGIKLAASSLSVAPASDATFGVSLATPTNVTTTAYAKSLVLKTAPGVLFGLSGYNSKTTEQFIQLHDATAEPTGTTAVPKVVVKVAASSPFALDFGPRGRSFAIGIVVCNSSTGPTAAVGAADCWFDGQVG